MQKGDRNLLLAGLNGGLDQMGICDIFMFANVVWLQTHAFQHVLQNVVYL